MDKVLPCCLPGGQPHVVQCADCFWLWTPSLSQAVLSRTAELIFFSVQDAIQSNVTERASRAPSLRKGLRACQGRNCQWPVTHKSGARRDLRNHLLVSLKAKCSDLRHLLGPTGLFVAEKEAEPSSRLPAPGPAHFLLSQKMSRRSPPSALLDAC